MTTAATQNTQSTQKTLHVMCVHGTYVYEEAR